MAAASLSGSRGVAGGLFFLFTLLCLVCLASSSFDNDKLKNFKEVLQKVEQQLDHMKARRAIVPDYMTRYTSFTEQMMAFVDEISEEFSADSMPLKGILENSKSIMERTKTFIDGENEKLDASLADLELNVVKVKKLLKAFEEQHTEL